MQVTNTHMQETALLLLNGQCNPFIVLYPCLTTDLRLPLHFTREALSFYSREYLLRVLFVHKSISRLSKVKLNIY